MAIWGSVIYLVVSAVNSLVGTLIMAYYLETMLLICIRKAPFSVIPDICEVRPTKYDHDCVTVGVVILKKMDKWMT